tara:strand:+ start:896 stop:1828 length:933 start_codon:yes stop_codon:yes gene_type:complete
MMQESPKILVTGGNGYIASNLIELLKKENFECFSTQRKIINTSSKNIFLTNDINEKTNWAEPLKNIDIVIHAAATNSHRAGNESYESVNILGSANLAEQAIKAGVKRFIFLSTIKVNGNSSDLENPFTEKSPLNPQSDAYSNSKALAEVKLKKISRDSKMELVIIRLPMVYGEGIKNNFMKLKKIISLRIPLPFKGIENKRSIIYIRNLTDFIFKLLLKKDLQDIYLICDEGSISTLEMIKILSSNMDTEIKLFKVPKNILEFFFNFFFFKNLYQSLFGNLEINCEQSKKNLKWNPPYSTKEGLRNSSLK